mgnify:FL=1
MSQQLINRSTDLKRLVDEGYAVRVEDGHLVVEEIPYLDSGGNIRRGTFVCPLDATAEGTVPPSRHVMSFAGETPCDRKGRPLAALGPTSPTIKRLGELNLRCGFSNKPREANGRRGYRDYYEKVTTYEAIILSEVHAIDPTASSRVGALPPSASENDPFVFPDSASARAGISQLSKLFKGEIVALIGLGGTGSYILDHVSKAPVDEIWLFDGDKFYPHNAFRSPGAPARSELQPPPHKVEYHARRYAQMKNSIIPNPISLCADNIHHLDGATFAFVSMDAGPAKAKVIAKLEAMQLAFVDVGMGLHLGSRGIGGTLRAVLSTHETRDAIRPHIPLNNSGEDEIYTANIQVSDMNSLNADMAIQLWKAHRRFYASFGEPVWIYQVETHTMIREAA